MKKIKPMLSVSIFLVFAMSSVCFAQVDNTPLRCDSISVQRAAQLREAEMDSVTPIDFPKKVTVGPRDPSLPRPNNELEYQVARRNSEFVTCALRNEPSKDELRPIARVLLRNQDYDHLNQVAAYNCEALDKYKIRINEEFDDMITHDTFKGRTAKLVLQARASINVGCSPPQK